ncbi:hypothetical protein JR316_0005482 [Psilocybe cubensis]|uniref:Uncharacterized protein n=1 Tax=Psilocybe cubensis TaxID=181762 RepID=A0ACB8H686_PSICU|nr:hypothetical protein JR316_0005482 [Psilocybe cubensis]KAH9483376.1 hypothetical protein JR316_0005482 [Psilocybe cubensis]
MLYPRTNPYKPLHRALISVYRYTAVPHEYLQLRIAEVIHLQVETYGQETRPFKNAVEDIVVV